MRKIVFFRSTCGKLIASNGYMVCVLDTGSFTISRFVLIHINVVSVSPITSCSSNIDLKSNRYNCSKYVKPCSKRKYFELGATGVCEDKLERQHYQKEVLTRANTNLNFLRV